MPDKKIHIYRPGESHEPSRLTKELARAMAFFRETGTDRALTRLNRALKACFAADDTWRMALCDEADSMPGCPGFRARSLFTEEGGKPYRIAFTSDEESDRTEGDSAAVSYFCRKLAEEILADENCAGLILDPWGESVIVDRESLAGLFERSRDYRPEKRPALLPLSMIDTESELARLNDRPAYPTEEEMAERVEHDRESWILYRYQILADGRAAVLYEKEHVVEEDELEDDKWKDYLKGRTLYSFEAVLYDLKNGAKESERFDFSVYSAELPFVFLQDGALKALVKANTPGASGVYTLLHMAPGSDDDSQYEAGEEIVCAVMDSEGRLTVGRGENDEDPEHAPVIRWNPDGEADVTVHDRQSLRCCAMTLDAEENPCFHLYPSNVIQRIADGKVQECPTALQAFDGFGFSTDGSVMLAAYTEGCTGCRLWMQTVGGKNGYTNPKLLKPELTGEKGKIDPADYRAFGQPEFMKNFMLYRADSRLYAFDLDDLIS